FECNTIEFIRVYVKPGRPPKFARNVKAANELTGTKHLDLTQQVWFMYPKDVKRKGDHPAPFPEKLPARLIEMYTHGAAGDFPGEVVLDPFGGIGTTCSVAKRMRRRFVSIEIVPRFAEVARERVRNAVPGDVPLLLMGRPKYPGKAELQELAAAEAGTRG